MFYWWSDWTSTTASSILAPTGFPNPREGIMMWSVSGPRGYCNYEETDLDVLYWCATPEDPKHHLGTPFLGGKNLKWPMIITLNIALRLVLLQWTFIYVKKCYCFFYYFSQHTPSSFSAPDNCRFAGGSYRNLSIGKTRTEIKKKCCCSKEDELRLRKNDRHDYSKMVTSGSLSKF